MLSARRKSVSSKSSVGKTLSSTARRICTAERKTTIEAAIEIASSMSRPTAGSGTSMTKITLMAARGSAYSRSRFRNERAPAAGVARAAVLIGHLHQQAESMTGGGAGRRATAGAGLRLRGRAASRISCSTRWR